MAIFRQLFTPENRHENGGEDEWRWDRRSGVWECNGELSKTL
jgi:hypothetical protein